MHLYLHQRSDERDLEDIQGADFACLEDAVDEAIESARHLMIGRVSHGSAPEGWRFEITDKRGWILAVVPFKQMLGSDGSANNIKPRWYRIDAV